MHPEFAPVAFISAISVLIVLPWHWRAGNVATLALAFWLFISNIIYGADAVIWGDNAIITARVWCDITAKFIIGANLGPPLACLCICIHLEQVASVRIAQATLSDKRRRQIFEAVMCFVIPLVFMGLHYVVQGHRFDIIEEYGCRPATYFSIPSIFIVWLPPLLVSTISLVYAALALRHFMRRRLCFAAHLDRSKSALTTSRYLRLMLMAIAQMVLGVTVTGYALFFTSIAVPLRPWTTWADVHSDFGRIDQYPAILTPQRIRTTYYVLWWMVPASTLIFVMFFAFGRDAIDEYKKCFLWLRTRVLRQGTAVASPKIRLIDQIKHGLPKSQNTEILASTEATTISAFPFKEPVSPPSSQFTKDFADDDVSYYENSHYNSEADDTYCYKPKFSEAFTLPMSPVSDMSTSPSTTHDDISAPPSPLPPPPRHPRLRELLLVTQHTPTSPRPYTYPSNDASHRGINPSDIV